MFTPYYEFKRRLELHRMSKAALTHVAPEQSELVFVDHNRATWRIEVPGQNDRFMSLRSGAGDDFYVVHVDTERFYRTWLNCSPALRGIRCCDCVLRENMPNDYKYHWAVDGFSHGIDIPVPLAYAGAWMDEDLARIGFTNGITRTFWLIANRAPTFPIEVHGKRSADLLHSLVGVGSGPVQASSILKDCQCPMCTTSPAELEKLKAFMATTH